MQPDPILLVMPGPWGRAIAHLRVERRLTQRTVAKRAKMTPTTYGRIEAGKHTQTRKLQDIADVFGVPIELVLQQHSPLQTVAGTGNTSVSAFEALQHGQHRPLPPPDPPPAIFSQDNIKQFAHELGKQFRAATDQAERDRESKNPRPDQRPAKRDVVAPPKRRRR